MQRKDLIPCEKGRPEKDAEAGMEALLRALAKKGWNEVETQTI